jgi:predicted transcriptional regulator
MKTTVKQIATGTFIALLLLAVNVKAEGTEKTASINESIETTLILENWMTDETIWGTSFINIGEFYQETETGMELEIWMTNSETWNTTISCIQEPETMLELESWMFGSEIGIENNLVEDEILTIESWMIDSNLWK